jgi:glycosyltransferase involved in cell wall biosynthesis
MVHQLSEAIMNETGQISGSPPGISVIVCCYNSAARLHGTLERLAGQKVPEQLNWEVILLDNASTDDTAAFAVATWKQLNGPDVLRILSESKPGQMYARITGTRAARYDLLIFCDDDNFLGPDYIFYADQTMRMNRDIGAAGGQNTPTTDAAEYPEWFETYQDKYALGIPSSQSADVTHRGFVLGAGMVTRKNLFLEMYADKYPSLLRGRKGENLSTGDDFEYCKRLLLRGYKLFYNQNLHLTHFIPKERLTVPYREQLMKGIHDASPVLVEYDLATRVYNRFKNKNRLRLLLLTPFRIWLSRAGLMERVVIDEELTLYYLSPFSSKKNHTRAKIKDFMFRK